MFTSFDGSYKSKRNISLGGNKDRKDKDELLRKAQIEREYREQERIRLSSSIKIQRFYRSRKSIKQANQKQRTLWDHSDASIVDSAAHLLSFFNLNYDKGRLEKICSALITNNTLEVEIEKNAVRWNFILNGLILGCLESLLSYPIIHCRNDLRIISSIHRFLLYVLKVLNTTSHFPCTFYSIMGKFIIQNQPIAVQSEPLNWAFEITAIFENISCKSELYRPWGIFKHVFTIDNLGGQLMHFNGFKENFPLLPVMKNVPYINGNIIFDGYGEIVSFVSNMIQISYNMLNTNNAEVVKTYILAMESLLNFIEPDTFNQLEKEPGDENDLWSNEEEEIKSVNLKPFELNPHQKSSFQLLLNKATIKKLVNGIVDYSTLEAFAGLVTLFISQFKSSHQELLAIILFQSKNMIKSLWNIFSDSSLFKSSQLSLATSLTSDTVYASSWKCLCLLCELYCHLSLTLGDNEFFSSSSPLNISEVVVFSSTLKIMVFQLIWCSDTYPIFICNSKISKEYLGSLLIKTLNEIQNRDARRPFCPVDHWESGIDVKSWLEMVSFEEDTHPNAKVESCKLILKQVPYLIPFEDRIKLFRSLVNREQELISGPSWQPPVARAKIRRDNIFEDGFTHLNGLGSNLKRRIGITFIDEHGMEEMGVDGGGLFKEFLTSCLKEAFSPNVGLFETTAEHLLYPSSSEYATNPEQLASFEFLGRIIGKALYDGVLIDSPFAGFFLRKWLGIRSYLDDLPSLDKNLYQGLIFIKNYDGDVKDLALTFSLDETNFGVPRTVDLIPNGRSVMVTDENKIRYIYLVANYKLNVQISKQCAAFFNGLVDLINPSWLRIFNEQELQLLLGGTHMPIDIENMKSNVVYDSVYDPSHPTIVMFWNVVSSFSQNEKEMLIKFITSCSRPPILGFSDLNPKLSIKFAGRDEDRLPTASTCVNLLKLPAYTSEQVLREKLTYAINSGAGFDLS